MAEQSGWVVWGPGGGVKLGWARAWPDVRDLAGLSGRYALHNQNKGLALRNKTRLDSPTRPFLLCHIYRYCTPWKHDEENQSSKP